ncbi:MAG: hypothetical protein AAGM67_10810, partial [Bacteroidota bacterium]
MDHRSEWDKKDGRILVWHYIVNGILIERSLSDSTTEPSPYFFMEKQGKLCCVIGRVFKTSFDKDDPSTYFEVGTEEVKEMSDDPEPLLHICVAMPGEDVIRRKADNSAYEPNFDDALANNTRGLEPRAEAINGSYTPHWEQLSSFLIHAGPESGQVRLSYDRRWATRKGMERE